MGFIKASDLMKGESYIAEKLGEDPFILVFRYLGRNSENKLLISVPCVIKGDEIDVDPAEIQQVDEEDWSENPDEICVRVMTTAEKVLYGRKDI